MSESFVVLRSCFGSHYSAEMLKADVVVVPLSKHDISAGQMVALHGLACGKPVIITDTPIVREYFERTEPVLIVRPEDSQAIVDALRALADREDVLSIERNARAVFEARFNERVYAERLYAAITDYLKSCGK